ncbi:MAG: hypothetical protein JJU33_10610 [Phycisphaerales bacterium]|nr:hypothetical protein [Phycisphaerales bacterium]
MPPTPTRAARERKPSDADASPSRWVLPAWAVGLVVLVMALGSIGLGVGGPVAPFLALVGVLDAWGPVLLASVWMLGAAGLGLACSGLWRGSERWWIGAAVGPGLMLSLWHLFAMLGLMGAVVAWGLVFVGLAGLVWSVWTGRGERVRPSGWSLLLLPGTALLLVASASPPGWLWDTEFGGYDTLSYHLQLPNEWIRDGAVRPYEHNVYSYLPGYLEAAYAQLGVMSAAPAEGLGLAAGDGWRAISTQMLHAWFALLGAALVWRVVRRVGVDRGMDERVASAAGMIGGAFVLSTPWVIVTGSMSYNEMGVVAFFAGAMLACVDRGLGAGVRGALVGAMVGFACGCKPTAMLFAAPVAAACLLGLTGGRGRWIACGAGAIAGTITLAPWLVRNAIAGGNPVFPQFSGVFGRAHWSEEQVARYAAGHSFDGGLIDRVLMLASPIGDASRGFTHTQWGLAAPVLVFAIVLLLARREFRIWGVMLGAGVLVSLVLWMFATHLQSRFLLPLVVPAGVGLGLGLVVVAIARGVGGLPASGSSREDTRQRPVPLGAIWIAAAIVLVQAGVSVWNFARQRGGEPNAMLLAGVGMFTGESLRDEWALLPPAERREARLQLSPEAFVNLTLPDGETVYLLGDATPLYFRPPVLYHTTWDASPLGELVRKSPDDPAAWVAGLRAIGVRFVLVNPGEVYRLSERDGWYDPAVTLATIESLLEHTPPPLRVWTTPAGQPMRLLIDLGRSGEGREP